MSDETKYNVEVKQMEKTQKASKESLKALKGAVGGRQIARMKKESVDCPVLTRAVCFVDCFACHNFQRRIKGIVHCRGDPLP